jgi:hypothetical protein
MLSTRRRNINMVKNLKYICFVFLYFLFSVSLIAQDKEKVIIFEDHFDNNKHNWILQDDKNVTEKIADGKLIIQSRNTQYAWKTEYRSDINQNEDFSIETTLAMTEGQKADAYGLIWGGSRQNYYGFFLIGKKTYIILRNKDGNRELLTSWEKSKSLNPPPKQNKLFINKQNDSLYFYANDEFLLKMPFMRFFGDKVGFYLSTQMTVEVDNLILSQTNAISQKEREEEERQAEIELFKKRNWNVPNDEMPPQIEIEPVVIEKESSIAAEMLTFRPKFYKILRGLPDEQEYFENLDFREIKKQARDNPHALVLLGDMYRYGWQQKEPNLKRAMKSYEKAAEEGDSVAYHRLAFFAESGKFEDIEEAKFILNISKSAQMGFPIAQYDLGIVYLNGMFGIKKEWRAAEYWLKKCTSIENEPIMVKEAMIMLGRMYYHEDALKYGITPNLHEARKWLEKAHSKKDIEFIETSLSSYGKLRYLMEKLPGFLPGYNAFLDYSSFEHVKFLIDQLRVDKKLFGGNNAENYIKTLIEHVLYANFEKSKSDKDLLVDYINTIKQYDWLKPQRDFYVEKAFEQLLLVIDYSKFYEVKKYNELLQQNNYDREAQALRNLCVQTQFERSSKNLTKLLTLVESLFNERWLREESKMYMPVIINTYFELLEKSQKTELGLKADLFEPKGEYETTTEYDVRKQKAEDYNRLVAEKYEKLREDFNIRRIRFSFESISLDIQEVGRYNADKEELPIRINDQTEIIEIPRNEAQSFKQNIKDVEVYGEKQLLEDAATFDIFNIRIMHPMTGSVYYFGKQKSPLYLDYVALDDTASGGVPNLSTEIEFKEASGNNLLDAKEQGQFFVTVNNSGDGAARMVNMVMRAPDMAEIDYDREKLITVIPAGESKSVTFNVSATKYIQSGEVNFVISFNELKGFQPPPINIKIETQEFIEPKLEFVEAGIQEASGDGDNIIENGEIINVTALIQNKGQGKAVDSRAFIKFNDKNIICTTPNLIGQELGELNPGEARKINFSFVVNNAYTGSDVLPIDIKLSESEGEYGGTFPLGLEMKKVSVVAQNIKIKGQYSDEKMIEDVSLTADVDRNIPEIQEKKPNRYALIIGNEDYTKFQTGLRTEANVDYARNDATIFARYAEKTLGIPPENITLLTDAISSRMKSEIEKLSKIAQYESGNAELFFFYAGHGFPDEKSKESYIMPVDISGANVTSGIRLKELYNTLTKNDVKRVTVFLDACFSGGGRDAGLLSARAVKIKPKEETIQGKIVIFSASTGDQSSLPYDEKRHGMFTYFLLKKLQESKGNVTYKDLTDYIIREVQLNSVKINSKDQNPQVNYSNSVAGEWKEWTLN